MNNIKETLLMATELQELAAKRGLEYLRATGVTFAVNEPQIRYSETMIGLRFEEDYHNGPATEYVELDLVDLEMSRENWAKYLEGVVTEEKRKKDQEDQEYKDRVLRVKRAEFERLKAELGES
jgi:hypothetical protein